VMRIMFNKARLEPKRVVFPEGISRRIIRAASALVEERLARPILLGDPETIQAKAESLRVDLKGVEIVNPETHERFAEYQEELYRMRRRKGLRRLGASELLAGNPNYFGAMMVHMGDADALISGVTSNYPDTLRPALQVLQTAPGVSRVMGMYMMIVRNRVFFFADTTVNIEPTAEELADIALQSAVAAERFGIAPRVAMLSFSNFGGVRHPLAEKVRRATEIAKKKRPDLMIDGEMMADVALSPDEIEQHYAFSTLQGRANVLIFPDLQSANIAYKLTQKLGGAEAIGPILMGMGKPVHVLPSNAEVKDIVNIAAIAVVDAQEAANAADDDISTVC
jgi:malate dehydrogenase (oxaloacetate-decarboxylating)(NADP+)